MGYPNSVWGANMAPISNAVFQSKPSNRPTNSPAAREDTKINNPNPRERLRVLWNLARSISSAITNIRYIFPISASRAMVSVSGSKMARPLFPRMIPANSSPTRPGSLRRSNRGGKTKTTSSRTVREINGLSNERGAPWSTAARTILCSGRCNQ